MPLASGARSARARTRRGAGARAPSAVVADRRVAVATSTPATPKCKATANRRHPDADAARRRRRAGRAAPEQRDDVGGAAAASATSASRGDGARRREARRATRASKRERSSACRRRRARRTTTRRAERRLARVRSSSRAHHRAAEAAAPPTRTGVCGAVAAGEADPWPRAPRCAPTEADEHHAAVAPRAASVSSRAARRSRYSVSIADIGAHTSAQARGAGRRRTRRAGGRRHTRRGGG